MSTAAAAGLRVRIANARMYSVTPQVEALWRELLERVSSDAGVRFEYLPYPAPQPLEKLWARPDLGAVFMCGFPLALGLSPVVPIAAPIPRAPWAAGCAVYRSDLIVRADSSYRRLEDTFGGLLGWTVEHSHSGFNALRHHLLGYRSAARPTLYAQVAGGLITARNVLDSVREGRIDVGPLDAYWHMLIKRHAPQLCAGVRILSSTALAPSPPFVAAVGMPQEALARLRAAFLAAAQRSWFAPLGELLELQGFAAADAQNFEVLLQWHQEAHAAGYPQPA
jgi:ABC-type phosphate/phosphonate transport system substrate-binding protein